MYSSDVSNIQPYPRGKIFLQTLFFATLKVNIEFFSHGFWGSFFFMRTSFVLLWKQQTGIVYKGVCEPHTLFWLALWENCCSACKAARVCWWRKVKSVSLPSHCCPALTVITAAVQCSSDTLTLQLYLLMCVSVCVCVQNLSVWLSDEQVKHLAWACNAAE